MGRARIIWTVVFAFSTVACDGCGEPEAPTIDRPDLGVETSETPEGSAGSGQAPTVEADEPDEPPVVVEGSALGEGSALPTEPFVFDPSTATLDVLLERGSWVQIQARRPSLTPAEDARVVTWIQENVAYYADPLFAAMAAATPEGSGAPPFDQALLLSEFVLLVWQSDDPRRADRCAAVVEALLPHEPMPLDDGRIHDPIQEAVTGCLDVARQARTCPESTTRALVAHVPEASDNVFNQSLAWFRACAADDDDVRDAVETRLRAMDRAVRDGETLTIGLRPPAVTPLGIDPDDFPRVFAGN